MAEIIDLDSVLDKLRGFSPLQRVLLATAGTLQGTLAAYFGAPVVVDVISQERDGGHELLREVALVCRDRDLVACRARTRVRVSNPEIARLVDEREIGVGQALARLQASTAFELDETGRDNDSFWRRYRLTGHGFDFEITETFPARLYPDGHGAGL